MAKICLRDRYIKPDILSLYQDITCFYKPPNQEEFDDGVVIIDVKNLYYHILIDKDYAVKKHSFISPDWNLVTIQDKEQFSKICYKLQDHNITIETLKRELL